MYFLFAGYVLVLCMKVVPFNVNAMYLNIVLINQMSIPLKVISIIPERYL